MLPQHFRLGFLYGGVSHICEVLGHFPRRSRARNQQRLQVLAACHSGVRRLEALAPFSLFDEGTRDNKGVLYAFSLPEGDVKKSVAKIGPLGFVAAAERRMVRIGRRD